MKTYLEISITATEPQRELLIPTMIEMGCAGFQETETELLCYIDRDRIPGEQFLSFRTEIKKILQAISSNAEIKFRTFDDENWNERWEQSLQPIEIGKRLVIKPSWATYENREQRIVLHIDPKMSFGTGYHETTRLTLRLLEEYVHPGSRVLDVGTGTGVLAIAAIKLGASSAAGNDIDEWSIMNAKENVTKNGLDGIIGISMKSLDRFTPSSFNIITANLTLNTNVELLPDFYRLLQPNGILLLSGLLKHDEFTMKDQIGKKNFALLETISENEWIAIAAIKP